MKVALIAPSGVPFVVGGAEKLWWGLSQYVNRYTGHAMELIKLPSPERNFWEIAGSYERFSLLDLKHFDAVISTKYPAWMVDHPNHIVYLQHKLRGLYDTYPAHLSRQPKQLPSAVHPLWDLLKTQVHDRQQLPDIFDRIRDLQNSKSLHPEQLSELTALPGPLVRALVHKLDAIALQPRAIARYFAISRLVAEREAYFPQDTRVEVVPHPSNLEGLHEGPAEFVLTASRLDGPKRIDLLIKAYRRCKTDLPLWIAGDGPEEARLRGLAAGDDRIRFLGRLTDGELVDHYSRAALVPFVPFLEDMGLITLEAMASGKPVLTVTDAGGVTEFVQDGVNGRIVAPNEKALAGALEEMLANRASLQAMSEAARHTAAQVTWERTAQALLNAASEGMPVNMPNGLPRPARTSDRPRLLVVNTFGVYPPDNGGKKRLFYLYRGISKWADVTLLNLGTAGSKAEYREFGHHYREILVPPNDSFTQQEATLTRRLQRPVTDIAALLYAAHLPEFRNAFSHLALNADVVVAAHTYFEPLIDALWQGPVWYDAFNVEADMKADVLGIARLQPSQPDDPLETFNLQAQNADLLAVRQVAAAEGRLVRKAQRVWAVSEFDKQRFTALYGRDPDAIELAPNGTHFPEDGWLDAPRRARLKHALGFGEAPVALFVASYHGPNLAAADAVIDTAKQCPDWRFVVVGSVASHLRARRMPNNVYVTALVTEPELTALLRAADVGLNPMKQGSGTNLKMLDYAGHGALILSTPEGARGLAFVAGTHHIECDVTEFPTALNTLTSQTPAPNLPMRTAARTLAASHYTWDAIASKLGN